MRREHSVMARNNNPRFKDLCQLYCILTVHIPIHTVNGTDQHIERLRYLIDSVKSQAAISYLVDGSPIYLNNNTVPRYRLAEPPARRYSHI